MVEEKKDSLKDRIRVFAETKLKESKKNEKENDIEVPLYFTGGRHIL